MPASAVTRIGHELPEQRVDQLERRAASRGRLVVVLLVVVLLVLDLARLARGQPGAIRGAQQLGSRRIISGKRSITDFASSVFIRIASGMTCRSLGALALDRGRLGAPSCRRPDVGRRHALDALAVIVDGIEPERPRGIDRIAQLLDPPRSA